MEYLRRDNPAGWKHLATNQRHEPYRFWQKGGGYDRNIIGVDTPVKAVRYIHNNPVRKGLVETSDQWEYSSAASLAGYQVRADTHRPRQLPNPLTIGKLALAAATRGGPQNGSTPTIV